MTKKLDEIGLSHKIKSKIDQVKTRVASNWSDTAAADNDIITAMRDMTSRWTYHARIHGHDSATPSRLLAFVQQTYGQNAAVIAAKWMADKGWVQDTAGKRGVGASPVVDALVGKVGEAISTMTSLLVQDTLSPEDEKAVKEILDGIRIVGEKSRTETDNVAARRKMQGAYRSALQAVQSLAQQEGPSKHLKAMRFHELLKLDTGGAKQNTPFQNPWSKKNEGAFIRRDALTENMITRLLAEAPNEVNDAADPDRKLAKNDVAGFFKGLSQKLLQVGIITMNGSADEQADGGGRSGSGDGSSGNKGRSGTSDEPATRSVEDLTVSMRNGVAQTGDSMNYEAQLQQALMMAQRNAKNFDGFKSSFNQQGLQDVLKPLMNDPLKLFWLMSRDS